jgi:predicted transcriptional regulator
MSSFSSFLQHEKIKLPSGKEIGFREMLSFCYGFSETDFTVLSTLMSEEPKSIEKIAEELKLSKASVNRSVNKLVSAGFANRIKDMQSKAGRPKYLYKIIDIEELINKISIDVSRCSEVLRDLVIKTLKKEIR